MDNVSVENIIPDSPGKKRDCGNAENADKKKNTERKDTLFHKEKNRFCLIYTYR